MKLNRYDIIVLRTALGLTQRQLGFLIDKTPEYISMIENGKKPLTGNVQELIADRLKVDDEVLLAVRMLSNRLKELENKGN
ncbi:transcriptional regulator with XRE-family HTH domain [Peribacillus sp. B2I2]|uniref:helix-turn-helix domain-containing protein n=1 Tax=Peribacillus sp. B2I2 TaxID=3156468 RepID=UPI0035115014